MKKTTLKESQLLKEGTSNFGYMGNLPLYVFYTYDEVMYNMENSDDYPDEDDFYNEEGDFDEDAYSNAVETFEDEYWKGIDICVLDEDEQDRLNERIGDLNRALKDKSDALEDEAWERDHDDSDGEASGISIDEYNDLMYKSELFADLATFEVKSGYYSAAYIDNDYITSFDKIDEESKKFILDELKKIKDEFGLTQLKVAWGPASNGETGYKKVEEEFLKEDISVGLSFKEKDLSKIKDKVDTFDFKELVDIDEEPNKYGICHIWIDTRGLDTSEENKVNDFIKELKSIIEVDESLKEDQSKEVISYDVDNNGTLHIYLGSKILSDVSDCSGKTQEEIEVIVEDTLNDLGYVWLEDGTVKNVTETVEGLNESPTYDLSPEYDSRQSFYGKARVDTGSNDDENKLYSYGTLVAEIKDGKPVVYGTYSQTTLRHIKDWLKQNGFKADSLSQIKQDYMQKYRDEALKEAKVDDEEALGEFIFEDGEKYWVDGTRSHTRDYHWEEVRIYSQRTYRTVGYGKYKWLNRPWYRFTYASAFRNAFVDAFGNNWYDFVEGMIDVSSSVKDCCAKITDYFTKKHDAVNEGKIEGTPSEKDYEKAVKKHKASNKKGAINNLFQLGGDPKKSMEVFNQNMDVTPNGSIGEGMEDKVKSTTVNFTKKSGLINCNKGAQQTEVETALKNHKYDFETTAGKGGKVSIKYTKVESLEESSSLQERMTLDFESDNFIAKCEFKPGKFRNYYYVHLIDKGNNREYAKGTYGWINRPWERFDYQSALLDACRKYGLSDEKIDALRKYDTFDATLKAFDEMVNSKNESLKELYQAKIHCTDGSDFYGLELYDLPSNNEEEIKDYAIENGAYKEDQRNDLEVYDIKLQESLKEAFTAEYISTNADLSSLEDLCKKYKVELDYYSDKNIGLYGEENNVNQVISELKKSYEVVSESLKEDDWDFMRKVKDVSQEDLMNALKKSVPNKQYKDLVQDGTIKIASLRSLDATQKEKLLKQLNLAESLKEGLMRAYFEDEDAWYVVDETSYKVVDGPFETLSDSDKAGYDNLPYEAPRSKESTKKNYNELFGEFLELIEFGLVKYQDGYGLIDGQGANLGNIEEDRFNTAREIVDRCDAYVGDYLLSDEDWGTYDSLEDLIKSSPNHPMIEMVDLLVNHIDEVDLDAVPHMVAESLEEGAQGKKEEGKEFVIYRTDLEDEKKAPIIAIRSTRTEAESVARFNKKYPNLSYDEVPKGKFKVGDDFYGPFDDQWDLKETFYWNPKDAKEKSWFKVDSNKYDIKDEEWEAFKKYLKDNNIENDITGDILYLFINQEIGNKLFANTFIKRNDLRRATKKDKEEMDLGESLKESKDEERVSGYQSRIDALGVSEDEYKKVIEIADDYESKAHKGFISYKEMDEVANKMGLKDMSDSELARAWKVYYYILSKESFSDEGDSFEKWEKYSDAASAFAEVINREARERKATGNYAPKKGEPLNLKNIIGDEFIVDDDGLIYISSDTISKIVNRAKDIDMSFEELLSQKFEATKDGVWGNLSLKDYEKAIKHFWDLKM